MRVLSLLGIVTAVALLAWPVCADDGQGTAAPDASVDELNLGTYWYGANVDKRALIGKVVLVEIWGS